MVAGTTYALLAIMFFSTYYVFGSLLTAYASILQILLINQIITLMISFWIVKKHNSLALTKKEMFRNKRFLFWVFIASLAVGVIAPLALLYGIAHTSPLNASLIKQLEVVFAVILAMVLLKETLNIKQIIGSVLMFAGFIYVSTQGFSYGINALSIGDVFVLVAALAYAFSAVIYKRYLKDLAPEMFLIIRNIISIGVVSTMLFYLSPTLALEPNYLSLNMIYGVFAALSQYFWFLSIRLSGPVIPEIMTLLSPLFVSSLSVLFLGESILEYQLIGAAMILIGMAIVEMNKNLIYDAERMLLNSKLRHII